MKKFISIIVFGYIFTTIAIADDMTGYCKSKAGYSVLVLRYKEQGVTKEDVLRSLQMTQNEGKEKGLSLPHFAYVDYQRVINDVYRTNKLVEKNLYLKEFQLCSQTGF